MKNNRSECYYSLVASFVLYRFVLVFHLARKHLAIFLIEMQQGRPKDASPHGRVLVEHIVEVFLIVLLILLLVWLFLYDVFVLPGKLIHADSHQVFLGTIEVEIRFKSTCFFNFFLFDDVRVDP